jgi:alkylhydroperoxidase family enzyme
MSDYPIHTKQTAPQGSQEPLAGLEQNIGFIPNLAGTIGGSPTAIQGFLAMQSSLRRAGLTPVEREVVGLTTSHANASEYSMAAHSTFALGHGAGADVVAALRAGEEVPDARLEALHAFTRELLSERGHVSDAELVEAGYSKENVLEVVTQVAYTTFANLVANLADTPVDEPFAPQAWSAAAA